MRGLAAAWPLTARSTGCTRVAQPCTRGTSWRCRGVFPPRAKLFHRQDGSPMCNGSYPMAAPCCECGTFGCAIPPRCLAGTRQSAPVRARKVRFDSGCARDIVEAASWAQRAAEGGIADAQALYAWILRDGPAELRDPEASAVWYRRAAESGSPEGWLGTGIALLRAAHGPADEATGAAAVTRAADARLPAALHLLGMLTEAGIGVPVDKIGGLIACSRPPLQAARQRPKPSGEISCCMAVMEAGKTSERGCAGCAVLPIREMRRPRPYWATYASVARLFRLM